MGGGPAGTTSYGLPQGPQQPTGPDTSLNPFAQALPGQQANILANQQQLDTMAGKAGQAASGTNPAFANYANAQNQLLNTQRLGATNQLNQQMANTGMGNSTAADNERNMLNLGYNQQQQALTGQLGLQGLQQQNQAFGAQAALLGQQNQMGNDYLQNYLAMPAMQIGQTAAQNAGNVPSSGKSGGK